MEHLFLQGTPTRPDSADHDSEIEAKGGWTNAWTGWESINFQVVAPVDSTDLAIDLIADQMVNSLFAAEKLDKERRVVLEELNGRLNSPSSKATDLFLRDVFGDHPAHNLPIGNRESINRSTRDVVVSFRDTYFVASNMAVAVVGDVQHDQIFPRLADAFANLRTGPTPAPNTAPVPAAVARAMTGTSPGQQARLVLGEPTVGLNSQDRYVHEIIDALIGEAGRRLERDLVDQRGIASSTFSFYMPLTDVGVWAIGASSRDADVDTVVDAIKGQLRTLRESPPAAADLEEAKAYLRGQRLLNRERSVDLAEELSDGDVLGYYESTASYIAHIEAVTAADVQRVAQAHLDPDTLTLVELRP
jgi:predicted Zn-dependent peptidase